MRTGYTAKADSKPFGAAAAAGSCSTVEDARKDDHSASGKLGSPRFSALVSPQIREALALGERGVRHCRSGRCAPDPEAGGACAPTIAQSAVLVPTVAKRRAAQGRISVLRQS